MSPRPQTIAIDLDVLVPPAALAAESYVRTFQLLDPELEAGVVHAVLQRTVGTAREVMVDLMAALPEAAQNAHLLQDAEEQPLWEAIDSTREAVLADLASDRHELRAMADPHALHVLEWARGQGLRVGLAAEAAGAARVLGAIGLEGVGVISTHDASVLVLAASPTAALASRAAGARVLLVAQGAGRPPAGGAAASAPALEVARSGPDLLAAVRRITAGG